MLIEQSEKDLFHLVIRSPSTGHPALRHQDWRAQQIANPVHSWYLSGVRRHTRQETSLKHCRLIAMLDRRGKVVRTTAGRL